MVSAAVADFIWSAALVAVIAIVGGDGTVVGAMKSPLLLIVPQAKPLHPVPDKLQITCVFDAPPTEALNCCVVPVGTEALVGITATTTRGTIVTFAEADLVGSATLIASTLTVAGEGAVVGAE